MHKVKIYILLVSCLLIISCIRNKNGQNHHHPAAEKNFFEVTEVLHGGSYSYLKVKENFEERWMAAGRQDISIGDVLYYDDALQMTNFHSKDLNRTFEVIYFVNQISKNPINHNHSDGNHRMDQLMTNAHTGKLEQNENIDIILEKTENEITIAQLYGKKDEFSEKEVEIRGIVVKINKGIMGKNWIHLQDGTQNNGSYDLTITTQHAPEINDVVVFKGVIILNKDFGSGYFYDLIMEDAEILQKSIL